MVIFSRPKARRREDLRHDWARVFALLAIARCNRGALLLLTVREDSRAVLIADVGSLTIELRRIVKLPKKLQESFITDALRVESYLDGFGVAGRVTANLTIGRILDVAADVTRNDIENAGYLAKGVFDAPEAAGCKGRDFGFHTFLERRSAPAGCVF